MTTRIDPASGSNVSTGATATRTTPAPAQPFRSVLQASAQTVVNGAEAAVRSLPGGPVLAAAVRNPAAVSAGPNSPEGSPGTAGAGGAGGAAGEQSDVERAMQANADQNLYYLELQERINAESRAYTATSNILKARHDTVKNAINNIR